MIYLSRIQIPRSYVCRITRPNAISLSHMRRYLHVVYRPASSEKKESFNSPLHNVDNEIWMEPVSPAVYWSGRIAKDFVYFWLSVSVIVYLWTEKIYYDYEYEEAMGMLRKASDGIYIHPDRKPTAEELVKQEEELYKNGEFEFEVDAHRKYETKYSMLKLPREPESLPGYPRIAGDMGAK